jgi:Ca2+:H+ antiporter
MSAQPGSADTEGRIRYSPATTPTSSHPPARVSVHRSLSSQWAPTDTPQHHHQGTSYFSARPVSPTLRRSSNSGMARSLSVGSARYRGARSTSLTSSHATTRGLPDDAPLLSEEDEDDHDSDDGKSDNRHRRISEHGEDDDGHDGSESEREEDPITLKDRQSLINVEHPFGLPIWKPALYKKSRSVTRYADQALHSVPSAQAERHLLPGNIFWVVFFGWWLLLSCFVISALLYVIPRGGKRYSTLFFGLGWYIAWPFGKYVEGDIHQDQLQEDEERHPRSGGVDASSAEPDADHDFPTPRGFDSQSRQSTITSSRPRNRYNSPSWNPTESDALLTNPSIIQATHPKSYGAAPTLRGMQSVKEQGTSDLLGKVCFWLAVVCVIAPLLLIVCIICWAMVFTIPMAKLNWALIKHLFQHPTSIRFCSAPAGIAVPVVHPETEDSDAPTQSSFTIKRARLSAGQAAPSGSPTSTVLLCIYHATGLQYYKYTVGGVNIFFVNLIPVVFLVILDGLVLLPFVEAREEAGKHIPVFLSFLASRTLIFILCLASVVPLSYFIGMAVASISAQSSIGMGAVINATFGSIIEILLYCIALTQGKGRLVEGSIVGSLLAGVLLMPGMSMCGGAVRRKEQKFNAKSAGVTSMMLIMAFIGTLAPTLFYQTYGSVSYVFHMLSEILIIVSSSRLFVTTAHLILPLMTLRGGVNSVIINIQILSETRSINPLSSP